MRVCGHLRVRGFPGKPGGGTVELGNPILKPIVGLRNGGAVESVGFQKVGTCREELPMDVSDQLRLGQSEEIVVTPLGHAVRRETLTSVIGFLKAVRLNHGAHGAIQHTDTVPEQGFQCANARGITPRQLKGGR